MKFMTTLAQKNREEGVELETSTNTMLVDQFYASLIAILWM